LLASVTAYYPTAAGAAGQDTALSLACIRFANSLLNAIDTERRWSLSYNNTPVVTVPGTAIYAIPTGMTAISHLYWIQSTAGSIVTMESYDVNELRRRFGEGTGAMAGSPRHFAVIGNNIEVFPTPDSNGPTGGNYTLEFQGYTRLTPIVQTTGTTVVGTATLTVPSTGYLTARSVPALGTYLSVASSGFTGPNAVNDTLFTSWSAFASPTTVTMGANAQITNASPVNVYFNSSNWVIQNFDHVILFGVLRDVAAYLKENFMTWDQRFQLAMENMAQEDVDRRKTMEAQGTGVTGQQQSQLAGSGRGGFWGDWSGYW
jgi:hypothetical protein